MGGRGGQQADAARSRGHGAMRILKAALAAAAGTAALAGCSLFGPPPEVDRSGEQRLEAAVAALEESADFRHVRSETTRRENYFTKDLLAVVPRSLEVELVPEADIARAAVLLEQVGAEHALVPVVEVDGPRVVLRPDGSPKGPVMAAETWQGLLGLGRDGAVSGLSVTGGADDGLWLTLAAEADSVEAAADAVVEVRRLDRPADVTDGDYRIRVAGEPPERPFYSQTGPLVEGEDGHDDEAHRRGPELLRLADAADLGPLQAFGYHLDGDSMRSLRTGRPAVDVVLHHDERTDGPLDDVTVEASQREAAVRFADAVEELLDEPVDVEVHVGKSNGPEVLARHRGPRPGHQEEGRDDEGN